MATTRTLKLADLRFVVKIALPEGISNPDGICDDLSMDILRAFDQAEALVRAAASKTQETTGFRVTVEAV